MKAFLTLAAFVSLAGCGGSATPDPRSADPYDRYLGALELADSREPVNERALVRLLGDPDPLARDGAVVGLGELGRREYAGRVIETLRIRYGCEAHPEVVADAPGICPKCNGTMGFAMSGPTKANTELVRSDACRTLARLGGDESKAALLAALAKDPSAEVRRTAALTLAKLPSDRVSHEALVAALADRAPDVRYDAWQSLLALTGRKELPREPEAWKAWLDAQPK